MRCLFLCVAALFGGIYTAVGCPYLIPMAFLLFLCFVLLVSCFFTKRARLPFCVVLFFIVGALRVSYAADVSRHPLQAYLDEYVTVTAECVKKPQIKPDGTVRVTARLKNIEFMQNTVDSGGETVRLVLHAGEKIPAFGESFTALCCFKTPSDSYNSTDFNYRLHLRSKGIFYTGTVESGTLRVTGQFRLSPLQWLYALQQRSAKTLAAEAPQEAAAVLQAVALGDDSYMPEGLTEDLQGSGLSHMTAVSGMHVSTLVSAVYMVLAALHRDKYRYSWVVAVFIVFFMVFTGMSPSVVRASVMNLIVLGSYVLYRSADPLTSLAFAAGLLVSFNPYAAFDMGFILSFTSTLGILLFTQPLQEAAQRRFIYKISAKSNQYSRRAKRKAACLNGLVAANAVTVSAQLVTLPVASWLFGYTSCWSLLTNLLAAPLAAVILISGFLMALCSLLLPVLSKPMAGFCYPFVRLFLLVVKGFGNLRGSLMSLKAFSPFSVYIYIVFLFGLFKGLKRQYRQMGVAFGAVFLMLCLFLCPLWPDGDVARVTFLNVGQGDCTLLQLPNDVTVLVDGGGVSEYTQSDFDVGSRVVMPYLRKAGIKKIDYMIASHPHEDHIGGLKSLMNLISVEQLCVPIGFADSREGQQFLHKAETLGIPVCTLQRDMVLSFSGDAFVHVLMPDEEWSDYTEDENDLSLVLRFVYGRTQLLLTGDLGAEGEARLAEGQPIRGYTTIAKAAHHGSAASTTDAYLDWLKPRFAVISCGENSFGHPSAEALNRLAAHDVTVYRTDEQKNITFILGKKGVKAIKTGDNRYDED